MRDTDFISAGRSSVAAVLHLYLGFRYSFAEPNAEQESRPHGRSYVDEADVAPVDSIPSPGLVEDFPTNIRARV